MEHLFQVQRFYNNNNFNTFVLVASKPYKGHHTFLVETIRDNEYEYMDLESASLLRWIIVSCLCHAVSTPFFFYFGEVLSLAIEDIAPGSSSLLDILLWLSMCTVKLRV